jgi:hypothetical protein
MYIRRLSTFLTRKKSTMQTENTDVAMLQIAWKMTRTQTPTMEGPPEAINEWYREEFTENYKAILEAFQEHQPQKTWTRTRESKK